MAVANEREDESEFLPLIDGGFGFPYIHFHDASSLFLSSSQRRRENPRVCEPRRGGFLFPSLQWTEEEAPPFPLPSLSLPSVSIIFSSSLFFFLLHPLAKRKEEEERRENLLDGPRGKERVKWAQAKKENRQLKKDLFAK